MNKSIGKLVFAGVGAWFGYEFGGQLLCSVIGSPTNLCAPYNESIPPSNILAALAGAAVGYALGG